ncbi:hypothetical protein BCR32DRAFT_291481 [Anaeromyces robustus]|uniref:Rho-GAP domain-containing protein n=1 Tax=Anaeromyces robustus TaxID=1754192 RepID=A0A1Y1XFU6_9FUNG|nr:hypothetical protein BCR32DRAFT_291481 [Anaeromyces robustus]|eukprot:ORX84254.1 hypothetical protein BCR32DRAFT_291481 [Anaeromyces robustus]
MDLNDDISSVIADFPYPPSNYPRIYTHEKCIDNPIHHPYLFELTISNYFSSKIENELKERDMIRKEFNLNPNLNPISKTIVPLNNNTFLPFSNAINTISNNEKIKLLSKSFSSCDPLSVMANPVDITLAPKSIRNSRHSFSGNNDSVIVYPLEKIRLRDSINILRNDLPNIIYPTSEHSSISKSNPVLTDNNSKNIFRTSLQKIKFNKSKSMNSIRNSYESNGNNGKEYSFIRELSNDFKKLLGGIHKEDSSTKSNNKNKRYSDSLMFNNKKEFLRNYSERVSLKRISMNENDFYQSYKYNTELNQHNENENNIGNNELEQNNNNNNNNNNNYIHSEDMTVNINNENENKINNNTLKQNNNNIYSENVNNNNELKHIDNNNNNNNNDNNNNNNNSILNNSENINELIETIQIIKNDKELTKSKDLNNEEKINNNQYKLNKIITNNNSPKNNELLSPTDFDVCKLEKNIDESRKSILINKSISITLLAPIASISLTSSDEKTLESNNKSKSIEDENITKKDTNEYSPEYINKISNQRIERYKLNNGFVKDRIEKFKSCDEVSKKPLKISTSNISNSKVFHIKTTSFESPTICYNSDDIIYSPLQNKFKNGDNIQYSDLQIFEKYKSNDDIIKEKINILNQSTYMNEFSPNCNFKFSFESIKENDFLEYMEILRQGILGTISEDKKEKLNEFLIYSSDENIYKYQNQIHEEYYNQKQLNNIENKHIKINKYILNFGTTKMKIPIEEEVNDSITIESTGSNIKYSFEYTNKNKNYYLKISPDSGQLTSGSQNLTFSLTCKTTMNQSIVIPLLIDEIYYFIVLRIKSQNSCFGVNIKNCEMETDSVFMSNQYSIPKILKTYRTLLKSKCAYNYGFDIFNNKQNEEEVIKIKKQIIKNEDVTSNDVYSIAYLFKNWFCELPRKLLYQIKQEELLNQSDFDKMNDKITGLERVVFSWLIDCFVEIQNSLSNKDEMKLIIKSFVPGLYDINYERNSEKYNKLVNNLESFINYSIHKRKENIN